MVRAHYDQLFPVRRLWIILAASMVVMFATFLYFGREVYQAAPPIPEAMQTESGKTLFTRDSAEIHLSEITVKVHRHKVMKKLGAKSPAELVKMAADLGIVKG